MLGIDSKKTPLVTGTYAKDIREAVRRVHQGRLSDTDMKIVARSASVKQEYNAIWK